LAGVDKVQAEKKPPKEVISFGTLRAPSPDEARSQALAWLRGVSKTDDNTMQAFDAIWAEGDRPLLDRLAQTLALGDADAARALEQARDGAQGAPTGVPDAIKDSKRPAFYRANLGLAYAKWLSQRRVYEEALETLKCVRPEQVVDPGAYLFHRAVAEHALVLKEDAVRSIARLMEDTVDVPQRYVEVARLMVLDMRSWRDDKDLGWVARKMDNIERRLELARGGPQTQKIQKEVVARLDEIIKQMENQAKGGD
jgi:hypothetical protein